MGERSHNTTRKAWDNLSSGCGKAYYLTYLSSVSTGRKKIMARPHWLTRASARVVLASYMTQLFAPVVYAMEGGVETQTSFDHFSHRGSESAKLALLSSSVKRVKLHKRVQSLLGLIFVALNAKDWGSVRLTRML